MATSLDELEALYKAKQTEASSMAESAGSLGSSLLAAGGGVTGLVGAIAAPIAARYIGDAFGLNKRSAAEEQALGRIRNVAEGGRTAAQAALEYQRARVGQQAQQAAAMGPARERAARALVGQEQRIQAEGQVAGRLAEVKASEQARAQQMMADIETRAGESERQRQRQMVAGALTGGLGALAQAYGGYAAGQQRAKDLEAQAKAAGAALDTIKAAQGRTTPLSATQELAKPMTEAGKAQQAKQDDGASGMVTVTDGDPTIDPGTALSLDTKYQAAPDFQLSSRLKTPYSRSPFFSEASFGPGQLQLKQRRTRGSM